MRQMKYQWSCSPSFAGSSSPCSRHGRHLPFLTAGNPDARHEVTGSVQGGASGRAKGPSRPMGCLYSVALIVKSNGRRREGASIGGVDQAQGVDNLIRGIIRQIGHAVRRLGRYVLGVGIWVGACVGCSAWTDGLVCREMGI